MNWYQKKDYNSIAEVWGKLKTRKSLLSGENLLGVAKMFYNLNLLRSTEDIITHLKKYTMYKKLYKQADILLVRTFFKRSDYKKVLNLLSRLKKIQPENMSEFLYYKLVSLEEEKKEELLAKELEKIKPATPHNRYSYKALLLKSRHLELKKKYKEALTILNNAIKYKKTSPEDYLLQKADLLYHTDKLNAALTLYNRGEKTMQQQGDWILFQKINIMKHMKKKRKHPFTSEETGRETPKLILVETIEN